MSNLANTAQAAAYINQLTGLNLTEANLSHSRPGVIEFTTPEGTDAKALRKGITKALKVAYDDFKNHNGEQYTWDFMRNRRVTLCRNWSETSPSIGLVSFAK